MELSEEKKPGFSLVTLCPPMTLGRMVHPVESIDKLNESNSMLWSIAKGESPLPVGRVPLWVDVRDLAQAHVEALLRDEAGMKRYTPSAPERLTYSSTERWLLGSLGSSTIFSAMRFGTSSRKLTP